MKLENRNILITGASAGLGSEIAKACAKEGATVLLVGRNELRLNQLYDEIDSTSATTPAIIKMDLATALPTDYPKLVEDLTEEFGALHGLVHNAAIVGGLTPISNYSFEQWQQVLMTNLCGPFLLTQALLPLLKKADDASILFTCDEARRAYWGAYGVSKTALSAFAYILADELESNTAIRVNTINPGPMQTALRRRIMPGLADDPATDPATLVQRYLDLLAPESKPTTGQHFDLQPDFAIPEA